MRASDGQLLAERLVVQGTPPRNAAKAFRRTAWRDYIYAGAELVAMEAPVTAAAVCGSFSDPTLQAQVTPVRSAHITELRTCVTELRAQRGLGAPAWTDPTITPGSTPAKTAHITELRSSLAEVYTAAGLTPATYTDPTLTAGSTPIKGIHVAELRAAAASVPLPPPTMQRFYYHADQIGSVRAITNAAGQTVARYDYDPFGNLLEASTFANSRLFAGGERDAETQLDYFGARYYQPRTARFISPDDPAFGNPFDPQETNQYAYARNNPLIFVDPTGHKCEKGYDPEKGVFCSGVEAEDPTGARMRRGYLRSSSSSTACSIIY